MQGIARQQSTTYNQAGLPVIIKDANGHNTVHEYNKRYHKTRTIRPENLITAYTPNAYGDVTHQNNPGPNDITRVFDERRRLISETNGANETTTYEYDLNNNRTAVIKPEGQRWEYDFDHANRLTAVRNVPEAIETTYTYDAANNLTTITDAEQKVTTLGYDDRNRKTSKTYHDTQVVGYGYDKNGNLASTTLPNGVNITYGYDDLDRQTSQTYSGSHGDASVTFTLDGNGNIEQVQETINGQTHTTTMAYDDWDRRTQKVDRYGHTFEYIYDDNGNRKTFKDHNDQLTTYQYDKVNRLKSLGNPNTGTFSWTYNAAGIPEQLAYPNGSEANYAYDAANRISLIDNKQSGVTVTSHAYEYDKNGNRTQLTESNINASQITSYTYDDADRLTQVNYPNKIHSYTLDKVGNRDQEIIDDPINGINTITYNYNQRDQLTSVTDTEGLNVTYDYDEAGNQTLKTANGVTTDFSYTPRNRIKSITIGGAPPIEYQYDYSGQRVNIQSGGTEKRHLYDGLTLIAETNTIGNTLARYHYGLNHQVAETRNNQSAYYLTDSLGTTVAITNHDGSIQNRMDYDAWGNLNQESASSDSPFGFTGYQKDDDTGLYYANARYYDSFTGRFLREDPLFGEINTPASMHRYMYGFGNPSSWVDPTGKGNDTPHYYESLLIGDVVQLSQAHSIAFALGAQIGDEFEHHDAIYNSTSHVLNVGAFIFTASNSLFIQDDIDRLNESRNRVAINNCGGHALCGDSPMLVRNAFDDYVSNEAENIAQYGTADHAFTDSFYHIEKKTVGHGSREVSHKTVKGHLLEMKSTDQAFRYHHSKRMIAFRQRAAALYRYSVDNGLTTIGVEEFGERLNDAVKLLNQKNRELLKPHMEYGMHGTTFPHHKPDFSQVNPNHEFYYMKEILEERGFKNIPSTNAFEASHDIHKLLSRFSKMQLQEIATVMNPNAANRISDFDKERLITFINYRYDQYQHKSKEFIYQNVKQQQEDQVKESNTTPGNEGVSQ